MIKNGRTPSLLLIALIIVIFIISYNYWGLSQKASYLNENLIIDQEKLNILADTKGSLEKQNSIYANKIKELQEKAESVENTIKKKDTEIDELNSKNKYLKMENEKNLIELNELKSKVKTCDTKEGELQTEITNLKKENQDLKTEISSKTTSLTIKENCDEKVLAYKKSLFTSLENQDKALADKLKTLIDDPTKKSDKENRNLDDVKTNGEEKTNQTSNSSVKQMPLNDSVVKNTPVESQKDVAPIINS